MANLLKNSKRNKRTYYCKILYKKLKSESNQKQKQLTVQERQVEEICYLAMKGFSESKERNSADDEFLTLPKQNKGSETFCYLRNKYERDITKSWI